MVSYYFIYVNIKELTDNTDNLIETFKTPQVGPGYKIFNAKKNEAYTKLRITFTKLE